MTLTISLPTTLKLLRRFDFPHKLGILERLYGESLARHAICWVETSAGVRWKLDLTDSNLRWIVFGEYEGPGFFRWAHSFLPADGIIVDSGANIGQVLLYLAGWTPQGKVLAFEPNPHAADWLTECLRANPTLPVEIIQKGLGARAETLFLKDEGRVSNHGAQSFVAADGSIEISIVSLTEELSARGIDKVDLWKIDMEGYEPYALAGAMDLLRSKRIRAVYAEIMQSGDETFTQLTEVGYRAYTIRPNGKLAQSQKPTFDSNMLFLC